MDALADAPEKPKRVVNRRDFLYKWVDTAPLPEMRRLARIAHENKITIEEWADEYGCHPTTMSNHIVRVTTTLKTQKKCAEALDRILARKRAEAPPPPPPPSLKPPVEEVPDEVSIISLLRQIRDAVHEIAQGMDPT